MILTKFTHLKIIHTAGKNLSIADMLSRDFSSLTNSQCQIQHKTLPPQIEFSQLSSKNSITPVHYLVKHEEILPTQKMTPISFSLILAMTTIPSVSKIVETKLFTHQSLPFLSNLLYPSIQNIKNLSKNKSNHSYNKTLSLMNLI